MQNPNKLKNWDVMDLQSTTKQHSSKAASKVKHHLIRILKKRAARMNIRIALENI